MLLCGGVCECQTPTTPAGVAIPEPMPPSMGAASILWAESFSYTSDTALRAAYNSQSEPAIHEDATGGYGGTGAMGFDWPKQTNTTGTGSCNDADNFIEKGFPATTEIYIQYYVRYQAGFVFDWNYSGYGPCTGNAKKLFLVPAGGGGSDGHMNLISENHHIVLYDDHTGYATGLQTWAPNLRRGLGGWELTSDHLAFQGEHHAYIGRWLCLRLDRWCAQVEQDGINTLTTGGYDVADVPTVLESRVASRPIGMDQQHHHLEALRWAGFRWDAV